MSADALPPMLAYVVRREFPAEPAQGLALELVAGVLAMSGTARVLAATELPLNGKHHLRDRGVRLPDAFGRFVTVADELRRYLAS